MFSGLWATFGRYEVKEGLIRPVKGSTLRYYDPWIDFREPLDKNPVLHQPYQDLLDIADSEDYSEPRIVDWCSKNGLLGILLQTCDSISQPIEVGGESVGYRESFRESHGWKSIRGHGELFQTGAVIRKVGEFGERLEPSDSSWSRFFPDHKPGEPYPSPADSEHFWRRYCEPLDEFVAVAKIFGTAVEQTRLIKESATTSVEKSEQFANSAERQLHSLTAGVRPLFYVSESGTLEFGWSGGSLLADLAMMAVLDLTSHRLLRCANGTCRRLFTTKSTQAKFCSESCRSIQQMRGYRLRKREKK